MKFWDMEEFPHLGCVGIAVLECFDGSDAPS